MFCCDVADNFFGQPILDWPTRKCIALGSARGLSYLHDHCDPKIIHRDVKAANVLLDEEFEAVVGDFGLAKLLDYKDTHVTTAVRGTVGHIAPEYLSTGKSSEKTDLYGYGIMLLELITGQRAYDFQRLANDDDLMLLDWVGLSSAQSLCFVRNSTNVDFLRELHVSFLRELHVNFFKRPSCELFTRTTCELCKRSEALSIESFYSCFTSYHSDMQLCNDICAGQKITV